MIINEYASKIPVLMYHHIFDGDIMSSRFKRNSVVIANSMFQEQMKYLYNHGFYTATLKELEAFLTCNVRLPLKTVVITFDDGYKSNVDFAYPILKQYGFKAAVFIIGRLSELGVDDNSNLEYIKFDRMINFVDVFCFENHTYDLHYVEGEKPALLIKTKKEIKNDILALKEKIGSRYFAYPYGVYNDVTIDALKETNHKLAFTVKKGYVSKESMEYELPRIKIAQNISTEEFKSIVSSYK